MFETLRLHAERSGDIEQAAEILRLGGLVAFPTETVYGLGASALTPEAVAGIFIAKHRPSWDPLIVHLADAGLVNTITAIPPHLASRMSALMDAFWPGPLTLLLPRTELIPDEVTAGRSLVGVRVPAHPVAQALLHAVQLPLAAPSANRFGHVSPTTARHVLDDLDGRIQAVLDGGSTRVGVESTVLDAMRTPMVLYRNGAVTAEMLEEATGVPVQIFLAPERGASSPAPEGLPSPGVGMRHYAPEATLILTGPSLSALEARLRTAQAAGPGRVGVLLPAEWQLPANLVVPFVRWGSWSSPTSLATGLFAGLRTLEDLGVATIVCPLPPPGGLGDALRDRLLKAAKPTDADGKDGGLGLCTAR